MEQLDELRARVTFSDRVTVRGSTTTDDCDSIRKWWFNDIDLGYQCTLHTNIVAAIPEANTRLEIAAAVDGEMASIELPYRAGGMVRDLWSLHPAVRDQVPITEEAVDGAVSVSLSAEPFRAEFWPTVATAGMVSGGWDGPAISAADFAATEATAVVVLTIDIEYWNTDGIPDEPFDPTSDGAVWVEVEQGSVYAFELAYAVPVDAADGCLSDPMVDPSSLTRGDGSYAFLSFALIPDATATDSDRIRACITPLLGSGTAIQLLPDELNLLTEASPAPEEIAVE